MKAITIVKPGLVEIREIEKPAIGKDEAEYLTSAALKKLEQAGKVAGSGSTRARIWSLRRT